MEPEAEQEPLSVFVGDYVELINLRNAELNGENGTAKQILETGMISVELGVHKKCRLVCIKPKNLRIVASLAMVNDIKQRRDDGATVAALVSEGVPIAAIQRDDSNKMCSECCRPRHMCSCTYSYMPRR